MRRSDHAYGKARELRRSLSLPEGLLWRELKGRRVAPKFRKQHPVGTYVIDFYCAGAKLGIEIDGIGHDMGDRPARDTKRDQFLAEQGIETVRIPARRVLDDPKGVAEAIIKTCESRLK